MRSLLKNNRGFTLTELVVALGLTSILIVGVISSALFVRKFTADWSSRDKLADEAAFMRSEFNRQFHHVQTVDFVGDTLIILVSHSDSTTYLLRTGALWRGARKLTRPGIAVTSFELAPIDLHNPESSLHYGEDNVFFQLDFSLTEGGNSQQNYQFTFRNDNVYHKRN